MAFSPKPHFFFFVTIFLFTIINLFSNYVAAQDNEPRAFHIPIKKDPKTLQHYASLLFGTPQTNADAVIDLGGQFTSLDCKFKSSTRHSFSCNSNECKSIANWTHCGANDKCSLTSFNPFNKENSLLSGTLIEDQFDGHSTDGTVEHITTYSTYLTFSCVKSKSLKGLAKGTSGILGLGKWRMVSSISLPAKLTYDYNLHPMFALCLPSSTEYGFGDLFIGPRVTDLADVDINYTPLVYEAGSEYFVYAKSIRIDKRVVHFNTSLLDFKQSGVGGTKLSTATPYGILHSEIYKAVVGDFVKRTAERNITLVASVAPFGACFSTKNVRWTRGGPRVPEINIELPGNMARWTWKILGANSMVRVNEDVLCLGFVDGGTKGKAAIVLGGLQLEDNYLEFDLARSLLGFTSSLLPQGKRCSHFRNS